MKITIQSIWRMSRCAGVGGYKQLEGTVRFYLPGKIYIQ